MDEYLCYEFNRVMEIKDDTEAYASSSSSSSSSDYLPNDIIHQILNFLPDRKEVTKASILSKSWQGACSSHPILDFSGTCCFLRGRRRGKGKLFVKFVNNTMNMFDNGRTEIRRFKFDAQLVHIKVITLSLLLHKWITIALHKSKCLDLCIKIRHREFNQWFYHIPAAVLCSGSVQSLSLGFQVCLPSSFLDDAIINLCSLRSLEIYEAPGIGDKEFQRLLQGCPFIQNLTVDSSFISEIKASGLVNLEMIDISTHARRGDDAMKIESPTVKTLRLRSTAHESRTRHINVDCPNLKCLKLEDAHKSSEWFQEFLSKFPLLETLELYECTALRWIKIENPMLEKVELFDCQNLSLVKIHSPKLSTFKYRVVSWCTVPSMMVDNPKILQSGATFRFLRPYHLNPSWFLSLREMLQVASYGRSLSIKLNWREKFVKEAELWPLNTSACEIEELDLAIAAPPSSHFVILSRLFSTFHPSTLYASLFSNKDTDFFKFLCMNLANREGKSGCCCFNDIKCWKHQLQDVKIETVGGMEIGPLDWQILFQMLPNLTINDRVCFRLQWAT